MPITFTMPKLSPTMEEGQIVKWHKKVGDFVDAGEVLLEIATDKATVEHQALDEGWLKKILVPEGGTVHVNDPIAIFTEDEKEEIEGYQPQGAATPAVAGRAVNKEEKVSKQEDSPRPTREKTVGRGIASPLAKRLAKEKHLDLTAIVGTGPGGRVMSRDLEVSQQQHPKASIPKENPELPFSSYQEEKMSPMRKTIAARLQEAKGTIPHFYVTVELDAEPMIALREQLAAGKLKISYNDMIISASAHALKQHPVINSGFNSSRSTIVRFENVDIAVAVSLDQGLITPMIRNADKKTLEEISNEVRELIHKAREGSLKENEYRGGSFTVSNLGMFDVKEFSAIINPPQAAILAVGSILPKAIVKEGHVLAGQSLSLTLSADHRVIDGVAAAQFLKTLKKFLENPSLLVV